jgi:hypothetical protein
MFDVGRSMLNAERALASLEKTGEALTGIAGGNVRRSYSFFRREVLNAERALANLEKIGAAQTGMAGGNVRRSYSFFRRVCCECWIGRWLRAGLRRFMAERKRIQGTDEEPAEEFARHCRLAP